MTARLFRSVRGLAVAVALLSALPADAATLVYVNGCTGGCTFTPGPDNAVANTSALINQASGIAAFAHGSAVFDATVLCIEEGLAAYDLQVTTTDPSPTPHSELVLAGTSQNAGFPAGVRAVAPSTCGYVANAPAFVFANISPPEAVGLCALALQQLGFLAGLEPLLHCPDVMTFLPEDCGPKSFTDRDSTCGTTSAQPCQCGGTTRNSHAVMASVFGLGPFVFRDGFE